MRIWRELRFWWRYRRHPDVRASISPHPGPASAVARLRRRVLTDDWDGEDGSWNEHGVEKCPGCGCDAGHNYFDRSVCVCGSMHQCCSQCGYEYGCPLSVLDSGEAGS